MGSSVFAGKVASSWAKPALRVGFLHLFSAVVLDFADSIQAHLFSAVDPTAAA
jgi:hypothetical protein